jgi:hypothetical protein
VAFDNLLNAMSKFSLKPRNADSILYPSFYEHYFNPFLQRVAAAKTSGAGESKAESRTRRGRERERYPPSSPISLSFISPNVFIVYI